MKVLDKDTAQSTFDVSRETLDALEQFAELVLKWNPAINLISKSSLKDIWTRHVADSSQIYRFIPSAALRCVDIGSGGGFPAIILAIMALETAPERQFTLVESDRRKATFLQEAIRLLGLNVKVRSERIEALEPQYAELITARAVAPLSKLLAMAQPHICAQGICLFQKGEAHQTEIAEARKLFQFDCDAIPSQTDQNGVILRIHGIKNA